MTRAVRRWYVVVSVLVGIALENARRRRQERRDATDLGNGDAHLYSQLDRLPKAGK
jgi:hypothetical protein